MSVGNSCRCDSPRAPAVPWSGRSERGLLRRMSQRRGAAVLWHLSKGVPSYLSRALPLHWTQVSEAPGRREGVETITCRKMSPFSAWPLFIVTWRWGNHLRHQKIITYLPNQDLHRTFDLEKNLKNKFKAWNILKNGQIVLRAFKVIKSALNIFKSVLKFPKILKFPALPPPGALGGLHINLWESGSNGVTWCRPAI